MNFSCSQLKNLRDALAKAYTIGEKGVMPTREYLFGTAEELIETDKDKKKYIQRLLEQNFREDISSRKFFELFGGKAVEVFIFSGRF